jgi:hypothetical protein
MIVIRWLPKMDRFMISIHRIQSINLNTTTKSCELGTDKKEIKTADHQEWRCDSELLPQVSSQPSDHQHAHSRHKPRHLHHSFLTRTSYSFKEHILQKATLAKGSRLKYDKTQQDPLVSHVPIKQTECK